METEYEYEETKEPKPKWCQSLYIVSVRVSMSVWLHVCEMKINNKALNNRNFHSIAHFALFVVILD